MAGLDDLYAQIPTSEIATKLGADEGEVDSAVHTLVPALLGGLQQNSEDPEHASKIESAADTHAASGLLDAGGGTVQVNEDEGHQAVATLFGGNDTDQVASALAKGGAGNSDLLKKLLPVAAPDRVGLHRKTARSGGARSRKKEQSLRRRPGRRSGQHPRRWLGRQGPSAASSATC